MKNLEKYVDAFAFSHLYVSEDESKVFYLWSKDNAKKLYNLDLKDITDFSKGILAIDNDFSKGSFSINTFDAKNNTLYLIIDEANKENYNLWKLEVNSKTLSQVTFFQYVAGIVYSEDKSTCWCYDKNKLDDGSFRSDVYEIDLIKGTTNFLFNDLNRDYRIGWTPMSKLKNENAFIFTVDYLNQRKKTNIGYFSLSEKKWNLLLPNELEDQGNPSLNDDYPTREQILFESVHEGFQNIYEYSLLTKSFRKLTDLNSKNEALSITEKNGRKIITVVIKEQDKFFLKEYDSSGMTKNWILPSLVYLFDSKTNYWGIQTSSDDTNKFVSLDNEGLVKKMISLTTIDAKELEHTKTTWTSYKTFDDQEVKALLHLPTGPLKAATIIAFYGGDESYSRIVQFYAEMGIAVLSPAVRGSWGWGREWEKMLEGDLGGNEILDVIWGAKFLQEMLQLPCNKIGITGGSHGGFATLRAITMPENFKNIAETTFPFGFAVSQVGFADLEAFYHDSRIADWLVHLLGPFDRQKYLERSPLTFFDNLKTPLLIINGKNDSRVPYSTMEKFVEKLKNSKKDYELLIHENQGHGASDKATALLELKWQYKFLSRFV